MVETEEAAKKDATYYVENIRIHDLALLHLLINWRTSMDTGTNTLFFMYREPPEITSQLPCPDMTNDSADMTFQKNHDDENPESESDFHFPNPDLVNHSHRFLFCTRKLPGFRYV